MNNTTRNAAQTRPTVNYLAYDGYHVTMPVLRSNLAGIVDTLLDCQSKAYSAGHEEFSDVFAEAVDTIMEIMPAATPEARGKQGEADSTGETPGKE